MQLIIAESDAESFFERWLKRLSLSEQDAAASLTVVNIRSAQATTQLPAPTVRHSVSSGF